MTVCHSKIYGVFLLVFTGNLSKSLKINQTPKNVYQSGIFQCS